MELVYFFLHKHFCGGDCCGDDGRGKRGHRAAHSDLVDVVIQVTLADL